MKRRTAAALGWAVALGTAALALRWAGSGPLTGPPLTDPGRWGPWLESRDPIIAAFSIMRLAALGALWYLVAVTALGVAVRMAGSASLVRLTDRFTVAPVRRLLAGSLSFGLAASGVVAVAAPVLRLPVTAAAAQPAAPPVDIPPATVTMHLLSPSEVAPAPPAAPEVTSTVTTDRWTVKPGECFWSIAESVLTDQIGRRPTDPEIVPYWLRLIDANRHELVHGDDPDLVLPGQVFVTPAP